MSILKRHIFKIVLVILFGIFTSSCATTQYSKTYRQKQGLMLLDNTEMKVNKKYHSKHNIKTKRKSARRSKRR